MQIIKRRQLNCLPLLKGFCTCYRNANALSSIYICMYSVDLPIVSDSPAKLRSHLIWQLPQQQKENNTLNHLGTLSWKMYKSPQKLWLCTPMSALNHNSPGYTFKCANSQKHKNIWVIKDNSRLWLAGVFMLAWLHHTTQQMHCTSSPTTTTFNWKWVNGRNITPTQNSRVKKNTNSWSLNERKSHINVREIHNESALLLFRHH